MLVMNHIAVRLLYLLKSNANQPEEVIRKSIPVLILPDAIRMYVPREVSHFIEHPVTKEISTIVLRTTSNNLKGIESHFEINLQKDIPKSAFGEFLHPEKFKELNPHWIGTEYETHLRQDNEWQKWYYEVIDASKRFSNTFTYRKTGRVVNNITLTQELPLMDEALFLTVSQKIRKMYGILLNQNWFEKNVHQSLLRAYDKKLAENTWQYIQIPSIKKAIELPEFLDKDDLEVLINRLINISN